MPPVADGPAPQQTAAREGACHRAQRGEPGAAVALARGLQACKGRDGPFSGPARALRACKPRDSISNRRDRLTRPRAAVGWGAGQFLAKRGESLSVEARRSGSIAAAAHAGSDASPRTSRGATAHATCCHVCVFMPWLDAWDAAGCGHCRAGLGDGRRHAGDAWPTHPAAWDRRAGVGPVLLPAGRQGMALRTYGGATASGLHRK